MSQTKIPFFNYPHVFTQYEDEIMKAVQDVGRRGAFILQKDLEEFERGIEDFLGVKHAIGVSNGTDGLVCAYLAHGMKAGDEVIMSSHTYVATAGSVHFVGGSPVLVDIGPDHMMDPAQIEKTITPKTKYIVPTQLNGRTCRMDAIQEIADKHGLTVIEDSAQALGSEYKGKSAGSFGAAGMFSFYPAKVLGCLGDGGAIVTNDDEMATKMKLIRDHGRNDDGEMVSWGLNYRLDNLQAAILNIKLKHYKKDIERRREIARMYDEALGNIDAIDLPPSPDANPDHFDVYQNYEIEADRRDELKSYLADNGIGTIIQWGGTALHQIPALGLKGDVPNTTRMTARFLMLPMHTALTDDNVATVADTIRKFYSS